MKQTSRLVVISGLFFMLIFSYQNCSVYKSDGRKFLEGTGINTEEAADDGSGFAKVEDNSCEQYLSAGALASLAMNSAIQIRAFVDVDKMSLHCMYSMEGSKLSFDHLSCEISEEIYQKLSFPSVGSEIVYEDQDIGVLSLSPESESSEYCQVAGPRFGQAAGKCCVDLAGDFQKQKQDLLKVSKEFARSIR